MWTMLGARGLDILGWESFGKGWITDAVKQLKLDDIRVMEADYGSLPDLSAVDFTRDVAFTWNGTTSGVRVPNGDWIADTRAGLTLCDATSAAFAMDLPWEKLDVTTYSWQKVLGGEAAHGMLILSPRAVERLESYTPPWPLPKVFRLTKGGKLIDGIFRGETINTPSMLAVEDYLDTLKWAESLGGLNGLLGRVADNMSVLTNWVAASDWAAFLCEDSANLSTTSVCLKITDPDLLAQDDEAQTAFAKRLAALLESEGVAYDIGAYRDAPAGLRIWAGATVEAQDLAALMPWLDWAYATAKSEI
jgi:phosphoserine aminotransferase